MGSSPTMPTTVDNIYLSVYNVVRLIIVISAYLFPKQLPHR